MRLEGDVVRRPAQPWTPTVHALLDHLRRRGLTCVPQPVGVEEGVEEVTALPGDAGAQCWPHQATDRGLRSAARLLRTVHDATRGWSPPEDARWALGARTGDDVLVCHGDPGPWNATWRGGEAVGLFDWDLAHPAPALDDVAYALEHLAPFRDDDEAARWRGFAAAPDRRRRVRVFVDAYGGAPADLDDAALVEAVIARQRQTVEDCAALAAAGVEPQRTWVADGFLDELRARVRWSEANRHLFS